MQNLDLYKCNICQNIVEVLSAGGGELVCCGKPMEKLEPKFFEEAIMEKHVPVFVKHNDNGYEVRVGEVLHPMTKEHYIMFIQAISPDKKCVQLKFLNPYEEPKMFLSKLDSDWFAREYCNMHGLWEGKND